MQNKFKEKNLEEFFLTKSILNGKEVMKYFKVEGKNISEKLDEILKWQSLNTKKTKEDYLKENKILD